MRLLKLEDNGEFSLVEFQGSNIPPYAILSHTWGSDKDEISFEDLKNNTSEVKAKAGYRKIRFCGDQAKRDGLQYFWVDTCCIDKSSSAELSEAINSMFRWYQKSTRCYAYLSDVSVLGSAAGGFFGFGLSSEHSMNQGFARSRWFTRGWTLQELIAPASVQFFSKEEQLLGNKQSLEQNLSKVTGIALKILRGGAISQLTIGERMSWAARRQTTREEDMIYCLLGIFDVHMPLIYGEGREKALRRLNREIRESQEEQALVLSLGVRNMSLNPQEIPRPRVKCQTCSRTYGTDEAANQHMDDTSHWSRITCETCDKIFRSNEAANQHMTAVGHWGPKIPCEKCRRKFYTEEAANQHMRTKVH